MDCQLTFGWPTYCFRHSDGLLEPPTQSEIQRWFCYVALFLSSCHSPKKQDVYNVWINRSWRWQAHGFSFASSKIREIGNKPLGWTAYIVSPFVQMALSCKSRWGNPSALHAVEWRRGWGRPLRQLIRRHGGSTGIDAQVFSIWCQELLLKPFKWSVKLFNHLITSPVDWLKLSWKTLHPGWLNRSTRCA